MQVSNHGRLSEASLRYTGGHRWVGSVLVRRWSRSGSLLVDSVTLTDRTRTPVRPDPNGSDDPPRSGVTYGRDVGLPLASVPGRHRARVLSVPDVGGPRVTSFGLTPTSLDTRGGAGVVHVLLRAYDHPSGVRDATLRLWAPGAEYTTAVHLVRDPSTARILRGSVDVPQRGATGTWSVSELEVADRAGNVRRLYPGSLPAGAPTGFDVVSDPATPPPPSPPAATVEAVTASTTQVDVRDADATLTYSVHVLNAPSSGPTLSLTGPELLYIRFGRAHLVSGSLKDGVWEIPTAVDSCVAVAGPHTPVVTPESTVTVPTLEVVAGDTTEPRLTVVRDPRVRVSFSEQVDGVTLGSLALTVQATGRRVPGHWRCTDAPAGDCFHGPTRRAVFVPDAALDPRPLLVSANPNHHLGMTDLAGNPALRRQYLVTG